MHDDRLQQLIRDAAPDYRVPADPPVDALWARIEAEHFDRASHGTPRFGAWRRWGPIAAGIAATLVAGFGIGRFTAPSADPFLDPVAVAAVARPVATVAEPLQRTTSQYLDDAALLLASLPSDAGRTDARFTNHAVQLLTMTRLLLDSPAAADLRLRELLEDLELVLAQVARLDAAPRAEELTFITTAMDERDVVPRLRTVAAAMSSANF